MGTVRETDLLEHDRDLLPVRRRPRIKLDHRPLSIYAARAVRQRMAAKARLVKAMRGVSAHSFAVAENLIHQVFIPRPPYRPEPVASDATGEW